MRIPTVTCLTVLLLFLGSMSQAQDIDPFLGQTINIRYSGSTGTAFRLIVNDKDYLVTAEHMVSSSSDEFMSIDLRDPKADAWQTLRFRVLQGEGPSRCDDVAVLIPTGAEIPALAASREQALRVRDVNLFLGQDLYFLGYPLNFYTAGRADLRITPLVKHAYFSGVVKCSSLPGGSGDRPALVLDGLNNHGFSGGPVVAPNLSLPNHPVVLVAVVSGFQPELSDVYAAGTESPIAAAAANTGLMLATNVAAVLELIKLKDTVRKP